MAASSAPRTAGPRKMLAFALLLAASLLNAGVMAQEEDVNGSTVPPLSPETTGPMSAGTSDAPASGDPQVLVYPDVGEVDQTGQTTAAAATAAGEAADEAGDDGDKILVEIRTEKVILTPVTEAPMPPRGDWPVNVPQVPPRGDGPVNVPQVPPRGDGPVNVPQPVPNGDVVCVSKEAVQDKNAVSLKLKASSNCEDTRVKIQSVLLELCGEDCKLDIYQEDNSDQIIVSGKYVEGDVVGMTNKFNNDNIKDKTDVEEASSHWGKSSKLVLVSLLLAGLLLAALLVAGYYLKTHYKASKGVRLAESFQVDEENQANTLVSVAPLPQEPLDKPTVNGESPPENGTNPAPATNGHSAAQTPVADTEM